MFGVTGRDFDHLEMPQCCFSERAARAADEIEHSVRDHVRKIPGGKESASTELVGPQASLSFEP
jgi:hypothetical protein